MVVAFLAVVMLAHLNNTGRISGAAHAEHIAGPPQIGDCLRGRAPDQGGWGFGGPLYPALRVGACSALIHRDGCS